MELTDKEYDFILFALRAQGKRSDHEAIKALIEKIEKRYDDCWILNVNEDIDVEGQYDIESGNAIDSYGVLIHLKKGVDYPLQSRPEENAFGQFTMMVNNHHAGMEYYVFDLDPKDFTTKNGVCDDVHIDAEDQVGDDDEMMDEEDE